MQKSEGSPNNPPEFQALAQLIHGPVIFLERTTAERWPVTFATGNILALTGYSPDEFREGLCFADVVHPEDRARLDEELRYCLGLQDPCSLQSYRIVHRDGSIRWVRDYAAAPAGIRTSALSFFGYLIDITAQKNNVDMLMLESVKYRSFFEKHSCIFLLIDPTTGQIAKANRSASNFYGYTTEELEKMTIHDLNILAVDEVRERMQEASKLQKNYFVFPHRLKDGSTRSVEVHSTPIQVSDRTYLFSMIHDATERQTEAAVSEIFAAMAHQWKQPLNAVSLMVQYILETSKSAQLKPEFPDLIEKTVDDIGRQLRYMARSIDGLRDAFKSPALERVFSVRQSVDECVRMLAARCAQNNVEIEIGHEDFEVTGFISLFKQAVSALLDTSLRSIEEGRGSSPGARTHLHIGIRAAERCITINDRKSGSEQEESPAPAGTESILLSTEMAGDRQLSLPLLIVEAMHGEIHLHRKGDRPCFVLQF